MLLRCKYAQARFTHLPQIKPITGNFLILWSTIIFLYACHNKNTEHAESGNAAGTLAFALYYWTGNSSPSPSHGTQKSQTHRYYYLSIYFQTFPRRSCSISIQKPVVHPVVFEPDFELYCLDIFVLYPIISYILSISPCLLSIFHSKFFLRISNTPSNKFLLIVIMQQMQLTGQEGNK